MKNFFATFTTLAAIGTAVALVAHAATYNFYFNNTEQGDNSTATPNVTITDGRAPAKSPATQPSAGPQPEAAASTVPAPEAVASAPAPAPANQSVAAAPVRLELPPSFHPLRLELAMFKIDDHKGPGAGAGPMVQAAYFFSPYVGINAFLGSRTSYFSGSSSDPMGGAELEVTPGHFSFGRLNNVLNLGVLVGVSTIDPYQSNWVSPHLGGRIELNVAERWGLTASARFNASYGMGDAGLLVRL